MSRRNRAASPLSCPGGDSRLDMLQVCRTGSSPDLTGGQDRGSRHPPSGHSLARRDRRLDRRVRVTPLPHAGVQLREEDRHAASTTTSGHGDGSRGDRVSRLGVRRRGAARWPRVRRRPRRYRARSRHPRPLGSSTASDCKTPGTHLPRPARQGRVRTRSDPPFRSSSPGLATEAPLHDTVLDCGSDRGPPPALLERSSLDAAGRVARQAAGHLALSVRHNRQDRWQPTGGVR